MPTGTLRLAFPDQKAGLSRKRRPVVPQKSDKLASLLFGYKGSPTKRRRTELSCALGVLSCSSVLAKSHLRAQRKRPAMVPSINDSLMFIKGVHFPRRPHLFRQAGA